MYKNSEGTNRGPFELSFLVVFSLATPTFSFLILVGLTVIEFRFFDIFVL